MRLISILGVAALALVIVTTPILAHHKDGHGGGPSATGQSKSDKQKDRDNDNEAQSAKFGAESADDCADDARNHGQYVSCVAHLVQAEGGDDVETEDIGLDEDCDEFGSLVACAAHSDVGKDKDENGASAFSRDNDSDNDNDNGN
jgi:hypothetical protein